MIRHYYNPNAKNKGNLIHILIDNFFSYNFKKNFLIQKEN